MAKPAPAAPRPPPPSATRAQRTKDGLVVAVPSGGATIYVLLAGTELEQLRSESDPTYVVEVVVAWAYLMPADMAPGVLEYEAIASKRVGRVVISVISALPADWSHGFTRLLAAAAAAPCDRLEFGRSWNPRRRDRAHLSRCPLPRSRSRSVRG